MSSLLDKIKKIFSRKTKLLESGDGKNEGSTEDSYSKSEEYRKKLYEETQEKMKNFEGLSKNELEDAILREAGVNDVLIRNPQARKELVHNMTITGEPWYHFSIKDKVEVTNGDYSPLEEGVGAIQRLISCIRDKWKITENGVVYLDRMSNDGVICHNYRKVQTDGEKIFLEEEKVYYNNNMERGGKRNEKHIYNADGLELECEIGWDGKTKEITKRESIDKAEFTNQNGEVYYINLANTGFDIATLGFTHIDDDNGATRPKDKCIYPKFVDNEEDELLLSSAIPRPFKGEYMTTEQLKKVNEERRRWEKAQRLRSLGYRSRKNHNKRVIDMVEQSKFKDACYKYTGVNKEL